MGNSVDISLLSQELEPLNAQIDQLQTAVVTLEGELRVVEEELDAFAIDQQQFDILQQACGALEKLQELDAGGLFWDGLPEGAASSGHSERLRARIAAFEEQTRGLKEQQKSHQQKIDQHLELLDELFDEVQQAHAREERRQEEFVVEREMTPQPYRPMLMPWATDVQSEGRFRRALLISLCWSLLLGIVIPMVTVPIPERINVVQEIPKRLAMLLKQEAPVPPPPPVAIKPREQKPVEPEKKKTAKKEKAKQPEQVAKAKQPVKKPQPQGKPASGAPKVAKKKARNIGVLAFKSSFSDLMDEVPVAKLGTDARLKKADKKIPGQARAQRSLVAMAATGGGSSGISNFGVSRNLGNGGKGGGSGYGNAGEIGGVGTGKVESSVAGLTEQAGRPLSGGLGPARTDEEIQIVFDRYKATLYRIYNKELRKDPTLRGKLLLRLTIEPGGELSLCEVESTDLDSATLVTKIVARVKRFNFGPKEDVPKVTILYPIDFLPAG
jgi:hypothetical protein